MKKTKRKLPIKEKISWGLGGFSEQIAVNGLNNLFLPIFNIGLGLDSKLIGWAITIPRFFDMISDPIVGNASDNCDSRYGRRRPFIFIGGVLMAFIFALTYMASPHWSTWFMFSYATLACILFYLAYTVYSVPYTALGLELTDDYDERAHIQKYRLIFSSVATFTIPWIYKICLIVGEKSRAILEQEVVYWYERPLLLFSSLASDASVKVEVLGARYVAWGIAFLIIVSLVPTSFFIKEKGRVLGTKKIKLLDSAKLVSRNRSFSLLLIMILLVITGNFFVMPLLTYLNIFYVCGGDKAAGATLVGLFGSVQAIVMFVSCFVVPYLVQLLDKKKVLMMGLFMGAFASFLYFFIVDPAYPKLQLISAALSGFGLNCCWLLNGAFIADVCDEDELLFGTRREGMFSAAFGFIVKLSFTVIGVLLGYLLSIAGYEAGAETMSPETINSLRYFLAFFPMTCLLLAGFIFKFYPLSRERIHEIQKKLNEVHAVS